ncbi:pentapeptide repeat-containing protein [Actinomadura sp. 3N508]|uniref:pentapeptide repeat-containing protein n=1 Tax=Actinomadura sp. 3N508 TaxID=3375153 RepID=UPI0037B6F45E
MVTSTGGVAIAVVMVWMLGPGAKWWLVHVDGVQVGGNTGLAGKDLAQALDMVRGRAMAMGTGLLAAAAIYYTAANASSARRSAQAAIEGVDAARRTAEMTEAAQRRTFELAEKGQNRNHVLTERGQRTDRFTSAVEQLGNASPAVQLGGVHALAGLADDSPTTEFRQTCIDVLCAFLRLPYDPDPGDGPEQVEARKSFRALREVRHTVIRIMGNHLRDSAAVTWRGHRLDFTDVVFDGGDFREAVFEGATVSFRNARFVDDGIDLEDARFESGELEFEGSQITGGAINLSGANFKGGWISFSSARFESGEVTFIGAQCTGGWLSFSNVHFEGSKVFFNDVRFGDCKVDFHGALFEDGSVDFSGAEGKRPDGLPDDIAPWLS